MWIYYVMFAVVLSSGKGIEYRGRQEIRRMDIPEGETLSLTCKASPTKLRSYRWVYIRDGTRKPRVLSSGRRLVVGEPRLSIEAKPAGDHVELILNLSEIRSYEAGMFMCWRQGLKPDPQVFVRVLEQGTTEAEPISIEISAPSHVDYGGSVAIRCLIRPSWPGKVIWLKDGKEVLSDPVHTQRVEEKTTGELLAFLDVASVREGASYTCRVPSNPEAQASFNLVVRVARIESLTSSPNKDEIEYGQDLFLECVVSGTDDEILWLKVGKDLEVSSREGARIRKVDEIQHSEGGLKSTLQIHNFSVSDNGQYVCYVPGDSRSVLVNIEGRLPRVTSVKGWDFVVGEVLRLTCSTQYVKGEKKVTWLFEGQPLRSDWWAEKVVRDDIHNVTHHDLSLPIPTRAHVGTYTCTTPFGSASTVVREIVPPYVEESPPVKIEVPEGEELSLPCSVAGYPIPTVLWEKNIQGQWKIVEEAASEGETEVEAIEVRTEPLVEGNKKVGERQELRLSQALPFHSGKYRCRGDNERDSVVVETYVTTVAPVPAILELTADEVMEGEDLKITCSVVNWDGPVQFIKGFRVLDNSGDERFYTHLVAKEERKVGEEGRDGEGSVKRLRGVVYHHALIISDVTLDDQGYYECHAGKDVSKSVLVAVKLIPPEVVEVAASPAVVGGEFFVSCTITNMPSDQETVFYFEGRILNKHLNQRYSVHLAEKTGEVIINSRGRAEQATYVLKVLRAEPEDAGVYHCVVMDKYKGTVTVEVIDTEDVEEVFLEASSTWVGGDLVLRCTVINWDKDVTFYLNQTMLMSEEDSRFYLSRKIEGNATVHTLNIFDATPQDSGFYQCFTSPLVSADVNVTVRDLSELSVVLEQRPRGTPIWIEDEMILDCRVKGFKGHTHTIEFSHQGRPYLYLDPLIQGAHLNARASLLEEKEGPTLEDSELSYLMKLDKVQENDGGIWVCRATIPQAGYAKEAFVKVEIYVLPKFTQLPDSEIQVEYQSDVILNCIADGVPAPSVEWSKEADDETKANGTGSACLEINSFANEDAGTYICKASVFEHVISSSTKLSVMKELKFIEMPEPETIITEGNPALLRCMALSSPPSENPIVTWTRKGSDKVLSTGYEMVLYAIENPTEADAGEYVCKATIEGVEEVVSTRVIFARKTIGQTSQIPSSTPIPTLKAGRLVEISGPNAVEVGHSFTVMCLVSPMLAYYKYLVALNGVILTFGDQLSFPVQDPRMDVEVGRGGVGETLLRLTIQNVTLADEGSYECTVNTEPLARHSHFVAVVPKGSLPTYVTQETASPKDPSSSEGTEAWSSTPPISFAGPTSTSATPDSPTSDFDSDVIHPIPIGIEDSLRPKNISKTVFSGESVTLHCKLPYEKEAAIIWKQGEKNDALLFIDLLPIRNDARFHVEAPDDSTRNLIIKETRAGDSGTYTCVLDAFPDILLYAELHVLEGKSEASPVYETTYLYTTEEPKEKEETKQTPEPEVEVEVEIKPKSEWKEEEGLGEREEDEVEKVTTEETVTSEPLHTGIGKESEEEEDQEDKEKAELQPEPEVELPPEAGEEKEELDIEEPPQPELEKEEPDVKHEYVPQPEIKREEEPVVVVVGREEDKEQEEDEETKKSDLTKVTEQEPKIGGPDKLDETERWKENDDYEDHEYVIEEDLSPQELEPESEVDMESNIVPVTDITQPDTEKPEEKPKISHTEETSTFEAESVSSTPIMVFEVTEQQEQDKKEQTEKSGGEGTERPFTEAGSELPQGADEEITEVWTEVSTSARTISKSELDEDVAVDKQEESSSEEKPEVQISTLTPEVVDSTEEKLKEYQPEDDLETEEREKIEEESAKVPPAEEKPEEDESIKIPSAAEKPEEEEESIKVPPAEEKPEEESIKVPLMEKKPEGEETADLLPYKQDKEPEKDYDVESEMSPAEIEEKELLPAEPEVEATSPPQEYDDISKIVGSFDTSTIATQGRPEKQLTTESELYIEADEITVEPPVGPHVESELPKAPTGGDDDYYYTYTYDELSTPTPEEELPVLIATPGEDVKATLETEVILPCPTDAIPEDITWKESETLLFLGSLDLAGVEGLALSPEGQLRLLPGVAQTKDDKTYKCFVFNYELYEDQHVSSYDIKLVKREPPKQATTKWTGVRNNGTTFPPTSTFEFPGLEWQAVAVVANSRVSGTSLTEVLREGGINAILISVKNCRSSDGIDGWEEAQKVLKECESEVRHLSFVRNKQPVFIMLDFTVSLGLQFKLRYGSTLIYVHNPAVNLTAHVFGPLVPLPKENGYSSVECGSPVYSSQKEVLDALAFCKSSVGSTLLKLQEAYLSHSRKLPMA